ncbi:MAG: WG repeat-containing protein [archaeon]|nr:WG repeat-containing protein [archaeon]
MIWTNRQRTGYIENSKPLFGREFLEAFQFSEGVAAVRDRKGAYFIDTEGKPVFKQVFREAYPFVDGRAAVKDDLGMFHIRHDGSELYRHRFQWVSVFREGMCSVCNRNGSYTFMHSDYRLSDTCFLYTSDFHEGFASVLTSDGFMFVDKDLGDVFGRTFDYAGDFTDGKAPVVIDGLWYLVDREGNVSPEGYDAVSDSRNGFRTSRKGGETGVVDDGGWKRLFSIEEAMGERMPSWVDDVLCREWDSCLAFIRHSERAPKLLCEKMGIEVCNLTTEGCDLARHIGERLKPLAGKKVSVYSSRVTRCITTANCIVGGMGIRCGVTVSQEIGPMGRPFMGEADYTDEDFVKPIQLSSIDCIKGLPVKGWFPLDVMRDNILGYFLSLMEDGSFTICVSHDLFVSLITAAFSRRYPEYEWPDYCDGGLLLKRGEEVVFVWNGEEYPMGPGYGPIDHSPLPTGRSLEKTVREVPPIKDKDGEAVAWCNRSSDGVYSVADLDGRFFHVRDDGFRCYSCTFDLVGDMESEIAPVYREGRGSTHVTDFGDYLHNRWFLDCECYSEGLAAVRDEKGWTYIDVYGKPVFGDRFIHVRRFVHGRALVRTGHGFGMLSRDGTLSGLH